MNLKQFNPLKALNHWSTLEGILKGWNPPPISCEIDLSNLCNHNCIWCMYEDFKKREKSMLPTNTMLELINNLAGANVKSVTFTGGGEPLTSPDAVLAMYEAKNSGLEVGLVTNGGLMNQRVCKAAVETCKFIRISLDAATVETHTSLHRPKHKLTDNFDKIIENINILVGMRRGLRDDLTIGVAFLVHPLNDIGIFDAARLSKRIGVDYIQIRPVYIPGSQQSNWQFVEKAIEESMSLTDDEFSVFPILHRFDGMAEVDRTFSRCRAHALLGVVGADSNVYLCCQLRGDPEFSFGSLKKESFFEIWNSKKRQEVIKQINIEKCPPCRYTKYNELLDYLSDETRAHKNFL